MGEQEAAGYLGPQEVVIFSKDNWWKRPGADVLKTCIERFRIVCWCSINPAR